MQELTIKIKDERKLAFLLELLSQLDFVELESKFFTKPKKALKNSVAPTSESINEPSKPEIQAPNFAWAGVLANESEGMNSVQWQHKISDIIAEDAQPPRS